VKLQTIDAHRTIYLPARPKMQRIETTVGNTSTPTTANDVIAGTCNDPRLVKLSLEKIQGIHPAIVLLEQELDIPPLKLPSKYAASLDKELISMLARKPPIVFRGKRLCCIGNIRAFKLANAILPPDTQINCIELFDLTEEQIRTDHLTEFLFDPAVFGIHASDLEIVAEAARKAIRTKFWMPSDSPVEDYLSGLYCVDKRKLKQQTKTDCNTPTSVNLSSPSTQEEGSLGQTL